MLDSGARTTLRIRHAIGLLGLLAGTAACTRELPVVDDDALDTREGADRMQPSSRAAEGSGCKDRGAAQLVRRAREGKSITAIAGAGNDVFFTESSADQANLVTSVSRTVEVLYKLSGDTLQETVFYMPDPPSGVRSLVVGGDTLFFISTVPPSYRVAFYSMPLSGGTPKLIYTLEEDGVTGILGADDTYVYIHGEFVSARVARADGARTDLPSRGAVFATYYKDMLLYTLSGTDGQDGIYQLDGRTPTPAAVRLGAKTCPLLTQIVLTDQFAFCGDYDGISRFDTHAGAGASLTPVFQLPPEDGKNVDVRFSDLDGDNVYFRANINNAYDDRPIRRLNLKSAAVDVMSCNRKRTGSLAATASHIYWSERRAPDPTPEDGMYRVSKF